MTLKQLITLCTNKPTWITPITSYYAITLNDSKNFFNIDLKEVKFIPVSECEEMEFHILLNDNSWHIHCRFYHFQTFFGQFVTFQTWETSDKIRPNPLKKQNAFKKDDILIFKALGA